jgi:2-polyprenyl-3-methyl-5-hydroxy-6-metoxy-1,4-benzoquinol methylase
MDNLFLNQKDDQYYNFEKTRVVAAIPEGAHRILDIGCSNGRAGSKLLEMGKASEMVGVEIFEAAAKKAEKYYNMVYRDDIEELKLPYDSYFDYVICGDILEHLRDPWTMLGKIHNLLKPDGSLIVTLPNIRYWKIISHLIFLGKWDYTADGILDSTHLRFFTRNSFIRTLIQANYQIVFSEMWVNGRKKNMFNCATFGLLKEYLGSQFMVIAKKIKNI